MIFKSIAVLALAAALAVAASDAGAAAKKKTYFNLHSPGLKEFALLPTQYAGKSPPSCDGGNVSPPLAWSGAPASTKSYAIVIFDLLGNPPLGIVHWLAYGIPGTATSLKEGAGEADSTALVNGKNSLGMTAYFGPCPPPGTKPHPFVFMLMATDLAPDALTPGLDREGLATALKGHILDRTSLVLRYGQ